MSFYTSLTGLNAATTQLAVTSNNIANVATTGFKRSRADFGDIFATSPLQKASTVVGKGTALKQVSQEFSQGNIELSGNTLDLAVTGEGFFPLKSADGQDLYTRNGSFLLDDKNRVVNSAGQFLNVATVDSLGKADFDSALTPLKIDPATIGEAIATSEIDLSINFPAEGEIATFVDDLGVTRTKAFDPNDPTTYAKSSAVTIYDDNGNDFLLTVYYARTQVASADQPSNKWQSYVYLGDQLIEPALSQSTTTAGEPMYVNKYGQIQPESAVPVQLRSTNETYQKFNLDDLSNPIESTPASVNGAILTSLQYQTGEAEVAMTIGGLGLANESVESSINGIGDGATTVFTVPSTADVTTIDDLFVTVDGSAMFTPTLLDVTGDGTTSSYDLSSDGELGVYGPVMAADDLTIYQNGNELTAGTDFSVTDNVLSFTSVPSSGDFIRVMRSYQMNEVTPVATSFSGTQVTVDVTNGIGDDATTAFTLQSDIESDISSYAVLVDGTEMDEGVDFSISEDVITFNAAPASASVIQVVHKTQFTLASDIEDDLERYSFSYTDSDENETTLSFADGDFTVSGTTLTLASEVAVPLTMSVQSAQTTISASLSPVAVTNQQNTESLSEVVGDGATLAFTLDESVADDSLYTVTVNGAPQTVDTDFTIAGNTLTFNVAPGVGETIAVALTADSSAIGFAGAVGDATTTDFTLSNDISADIESYLVFVDSAEMVEGTDYTVTGSTLSFTTAPGAGEAIEIKSAKEFTLGSDIEATLDDHVVLVDGEQVTEFSVTGTALTFTNALDADATVQVINATQYGLGDSVINTGADDFTVLVDGVAATGVSISGSSVTFESAPAYGSTVEVISTVDYTLDQEIGDDAALYDVLLDGERLTLGTDYSITADTLALSRDIGATSTLQILRKNDFSFEGESDGTYTVELTEAPGEDAVITVAQAVTTEDWLNAIGDGSDATFNLSNSIRYTSDVSVLLDGVEQTYGSDYSISGSVLTFVNAPADGATITVRPADDTTSLAIQLREAFKVAIDVPDTVDDTNIAEQGYEVTIDLSELAGQSFNGKNLAAEVSRQLNEQLGSRAYFDLSNDSSLGKMTVAADATSTLDADSIDIDVVSYLVSEDADVDLAAITSEDFAAAIQDQLNESTEQSVTYSVDYSLADKAFKILRNDDATLTLEATLDADSVATNNQLFGLTGSVDRTLDPNTGMFIETSAYDVYANGDSVLDESVQRYGVKVEYDEATNQFSIASGTTGDTSNIRMYDVNEAVQEMLGFVTSQTTFDDADLVVNAKESTDLAERGLVSSAAKVFGNPLSVNVASTFEVNDLSNEFSVTVDNVTETFVIPEGTYNLNEFMSTLERRINAMADDDGRTVNGVSVSYDPTTEGLVFTSGTTGNESFLQVSGSSRWGLLNLDPGLGSTSTFIEPETFASANDLPAEVYVRFNNTTGRWEEYSASPDLNMLELTESQQFDETRQPQWRPLFLDKGELTFDTSGNLVSPLTGVELDNVVIGGSGNSLQIDIDYTGSTQFTGEFSVNAQSQNGQPNGNLVGLDIGDDGLVTASYSNGSQQLKGKIILANFSTPNGLRQLGDSTFLESAESGAATLAEPGSAGVGTIRAGARERANLDLTSELVDLITAQRNFQANAKGLETSTTLTQTIINIRG